MATVSVRYIVHDVEAAIGFYTRATRWSCSSRPGTRPGSRGIELNPGGSSRDPEG